LTESLHCSGGPANFDSEQHGWELVRGANLPSQKKIEVNGAALTYSEQGRGELVILVHGALGDYRIWNEQAATLAQQYHVVSYSRRYHQPNHSFNGPDDYTCRQHVDDLIALIHELRLGPAHLVGHSYGANVAALVAIKRPEMVNSLVLSEPTMFSVLSDPRDQVSVRLHRIALSVVQKLSESGESRLAVRAYLNIVTDKDDFDELPIESQLVITQNAHTLGPMLRKFFDEEDFDQERARSISTPTLVVTSERSPTIYRAIGQALVNCLPHSLFKSLAGPSHGLLLGNQPGFSAAVLKFLRQNEMAIKRELS
jgi:pimeloyl-ACP methyl ester carboxylesterase